LPHAFFDVTRKQSAEMKMKTHVYAFFLIFFQAGLSQAVTPQAAAEVCNRLNGDYLSQCRVLTATGLFDSLASGECDTFTDQPQTIACMKTIKNKKFQGSAVEACSRINDASSTTSCFASIANRTYSDSEVSFCDAMSEAEETMSCFARKGKAVAVILPLVYAWKTDITNALKVVGCTMAKGQDVPVDTELKDCEAKLKVTFQFTADGKACQELTDKNALISNPPLQTCISKISGLEAYWVNGDARVCSYVVRPALTVVSAPDASACTGISDEFDPKTNSFKYAETLGWSGDNGNHCSTSVKDPATGKLKGSRRIDISNCLTPALAFFQWVDEKSQSCLAYTSCGARIGNVDTEFCKGKPNHFAQTWPSRGYTWQSCYKSNTGTTIPFDAEGKFVSACAPDTLYAWHTDEQLNLAIRSESVSTLLKLKARSTRSFLWRTPVGSFGYGPRAVRLKLKPNVKFVKVEFDNRDCQTLKETYNVGKTVFTHASADIGNGDYSEYIICSDDVVESWSTDMSFAAQEMSKDYARVKAQEQAGTKNYDSLFGTDASTKPPWSIDQNWDNSFQTTDWSEDGLQTNIARAKAHSGEGRVYFDPQAVPSLWNHFATTTPGYFNAYDLSVNPRDTWPERDQTSCFAQ
jgi:hypothetical protein